MTVRELAKDDVVVYLGAKVMHEGKPWVTPGDVFVFKGAVLKRAACLYDDRDNFRMFVSVEDLMLLEEFERWDRWEEI